MMKNKMEEEEEELDVIRVAEKKLSTSEIAQRDVAKNQEKDHQIKEKQNAIINKF